MAIDPKLLQERLEKGITIEWSKIHGQYIAYSPLSKNYVLAMASTPFKVFEESVKKLAEGPLMIATG